MSISPNNLALTGRASELDDLISQSKSSDALVAAQIDALRVQIDLAYEAQTISLREWRVLVERFSTVRRRPRD